MDSSKRVGKLVRDRIPQIIESSGGRPQTEILGEDAFLSALHAKLDEEALEVHEASSQDLTEELADVLEVLHALAEANGISWHEVEERNLSKARDRGGFTDRIWLWS